MAITKTTGNLSLLDAARGLGPMNLPWALVARNDPNRTQLQVWNADFGGPRPTVYLRSNDAPIWISSDSQGRVTGIGLNGRPRYGVGPSSNPALTLQPGEVVTFTGEDAKHRVYGAQGPVRIRETF